MGGGGLADRAEQPGADLAGGQHAERELADAPAEADRRLAQADHPDRDLTDRDQPNRDLSDGDDADGYWQTLSWEQADTYPVDVILADVRGASIDSLLDLLPENPRRAYDMYKLIAALVDHGE